MKFSTRVHKFSATAFWNPLPGGLQKICSELWSRIYTTKLSSYLIAPFCSKYAINEQSLLDYRPSSDDVIYNSFQDFFTRKLKIPLLKGSSYVWPVQGYVCDFGLVKDLRPVKIKGEIHPVPYIFGNAENRIPGDYFFVNIFLHNHNYHRFHSPIDGTVINIEYVKGQLTFLRPWLYKKSLVSLPAFKNERIIIEIEDDHGRSWFVTFIGGMGVGKIKLHENVQVGKKIENSDEIGLFLLGSTCCLAIPEVVENLHYMKKIQVGNKLHS
ncbi:MAG: phosphatidylserine decarboxylase [Bacteriovorax sp.]|nr:phosphatidylserine decarboxylase [Bacteriovorax sp.]